MMPSPFLPGDCQATTLLAPDARVQVTASAIERLDSGRDFKISVRRSMGWWEGKDTAILCALLQSARTALLVPFPAFTVRLEITVTGTPLPDRPVLMAVISLNAVIADAALCGRWPASETLTLGRMQPDAPHAFLPLPAPWQQTALETLTGTALKRATVLLAPDPAAANWARAQEKMFPGFAFQQPHNLSALCQVASGDVRRATVHFPVVGNCAEADELLALSVHLYQDSTPASQDAHYRIVGEDCHHQPCIALLEAVRQADGQSLAGTVWRTTITLPENIRFGGRSYELALVLADRMVRQQEFFMPHGRLIATGAVSSRASGEDVRLTGNVNVSLPAEDAKEIDSLQRKLRLLAQAVQAGERIILPGNWRVQGAVHALQQTLAARNVSLVCVDNLRGG